MKRLILIGLVIMSFPAHSQKTAHIQQVVIPKNQTYNLDKVDSIATTNVAIYKGQKWPVWATSRGKLFITVYHKDGKYYRKYIKINQNFF